MSDARITELETKLAFMEHTVAELNDTVYAQQRTVEELRTWCQTLAQRMKTLHDDGGDQDGPAEHEVPPHY